MIRFAIALTALCTGAAANELTQDFLEAPGMVWVRTDFPAFSKEGKMDSLIPYLQFTDGEFESGLLAGYPSIYPNSCAEPYNCDARTTRGDVLSGPYTVVATGIQAQEGTTLSDWQFGEGTRHDWALAADGMYGGYAAISQRDDRLYQETEAGPRTYLRLPEHLIHSAFHLAELADQPVDLAYQCSLEQIAALAAAPVDQRTRTQKQFQALLNVLAVQMPAIHRQEVLDGIRGAGGLSPEQRTELDQLDAVTSMTAGLATLSESLLVRPEGFSFDPPELLEGSASQEAIDQVNMMMPLMVISRAPDPIAAQALFDELMPDMIAAAPLAAKTSHAVLLDEEGSAMSTVVCSKAG